MKSRIEHVAVVAPVCSKHNDDALVLRCSLLQSLFDFGVRIGGFGVNFILFWFRLTKKDSARHYGERETQHQNPPIDVHFDLLHEREYLSIRRETGPSVGRTDTFRF